MSSFEKCRTGEVWKVLFKKNVNDEKPLYLVVEILSLEARYPSHAQCKILAVLNKKNFKNTMTIKNMPWIEMNHIEIGKNIDIFFDFNEHQLQSSKRVSLEEASVWLL